MADFTGTEFEGMTEWEAMMKAGGWNELYAAVPDQFQANPNNTGVTGTGATANYDDVPAMSKEDAYAQAQATGNPVDFKGGDGKVATVSPSGVIITHQSDDPFSTAPPPTDNLYDANAAPPSDFVSENITGPAPDNAFATEGQMTGTWDDGSKTTVFDSNTGKYQTFTNDPNDPFAFRRNNPDIGYFQNQEGDYVYGVKPTESYTVGGVDDSSLYEGVDPNWVPITQPDMNGIGGDRQPDGSVGPNAGGQRTPDNTPIGGGIGAGDPFGWQGSDTHDIDGVLIPGSRADPNSRPTYERSGVPWYPVVEPLAGVTV
jgi:hypothetical protein